jgi:hypothetical protein
MCTLYTRPTMVLNHCHSWASTYLGCIVIAISPALRTSSRRCKKDELSVACLAEIKHIMRILVDGRTARHP